MVTDEEVERAYRNWYSVTAKKPVTLTQYKTVMARLPHDIKQINQWLNEGRQPI